RRPPRPPPRRGTWPWLDEPRRDVVREREAARGEPYLAARALDEPGTGEVGELRKRRIECAPEAVGERIDVDAGEAAQAREDKPRPGRRVAQVLLAGDGRPVLPDRREIARGQALVHPPPSRCGLGRERVCPRADAEVVRAVPVAEVVPRLTAGTGEARDL